MEMKTFMQLENSVRKQPGKVVVPCANNYEALSAIKLAMEKGFLNSGILIGEKKKITTCANEVGLDLQNFEHIEVSDQKEAAILSVKLLTKKQGDYLLKGQIDTKTYLKAILNKEFEVVKKGNLLSHIGLHEVPEYHKPFIVTDAAINISPDVEHKALIIKNAVKIAKKLGVATPKVAIVCAVEKVNPKMVSTLHARELAKMAKDKYFEDAIVEGPYDIYISLSKNAAIEKGVEGEVCGDADILVFPDINTANTIYKILQQLNNRSKNGSIIAGAEYPILLPSRTDPVSTKLNSLILASYLKNN